MKKADKDQTDKPLLSEDSQDEMIKSTLMFSEHIRVTTMVALITLVSISIFAFGGYKLDEYLDSKPLMLILGLVISFPISQVAIYRWVKRSYVPKIVKKSKEEK